MKDLGCFLLHMKNDIHTSNINIIIIFFNWTSHVIFTKNMYFEIYSRLNLVFLIERNQSFGKSDEILCLQAMLTAAQS